LLVDLVENENRDDGYRAAKKHQSDLFHLAPEWPHDMIHT
jgi:hypothetical protein